MKYSLTIILLLFVATVFAQNEKSNKLVQFSGIITDADSNAVVPYVTITNLSFKEGGQDPYKVIPNSIDRWIVSMASCSFVAP